MTKKQKNEDEFVSIAEFCNHCGISRVTFYKNLDKIEKYLDYTYQTSFETIVWHDILNIREFYKDSKKILISELEWETIEKRFHYSIMQSLHFIWMSSTTFQKKLKEEEFLNLFEKSKKIKKIKTINLKCSEDVMNYFYDNSKMFNREKDKNNNN